MQIKHAVYFLFACLLLATACKKDDNNTPTTPQNTNPFAGGKGGSFNRVIFSGHNSSPVAARVYVKYGDNKMPADTNLFDEKHNTITEPGFGPHVHFEHLTAGTYYFYATSGAYSTDTVIVLTDSSKIDGDVFINLQ
jgi:hypothetical protein